MPQWLKTCQFCHDPRCSQVIDKTLAETLLPRTAQSQFDGIILVVWIINVLIPIILILYNLYISSEILDVTLLACPIVRELQTLHCESNL